MKKLFALLLILFSLFCISATNQIGGVTDPDSIGGVPNESTSTVGGVTFTQAGGGPLLSIDFESDPAASWDATPFTLSSKAEDCDGYDADGDWCDYDATTYKNGTHALGIRGDYYIRKDISSTTEFYVEFWWYTSYTDWTQSRMSFKTSDGSQTVMEFRTSTQGNGEAWFYTNNGSTYQDVNWEPAASTWHHIGIYYKAGATGTGDATIIVWTNTDGGEFDAADLKVNVTNTNSISGGAVRVQLHGANAGQTGFWDDVVVTDGAPSWPTS